MNTLRLDLPLLLPELPDARDACVGRLQALLSPRRGILKTHLREAGDTPELCVHYDPALISGEEVRQIAHAAGADVHARVGHRVVPLRAVAGEDGGTRIEQTLSSIEGVLAVSVIVPASGVTATELLQVSAAVERQSQHPLAQAVVRKADTERVAPMTAEAVESVTGRGIRATVGGRWVEIGNLRMFEESKAEIPADVRAAVTRLQQDAGRSVMIVRREDGWLGVLGMADQPRPNVRAILDRIRQLGVNPLVMLTGDHRSVGEAVGRQVGVDEVRAELLPEAKVAAIQDLQQRHGGVAMVGDGVNDAPALAQATVGIAMGGAGTAAALETADVALMADDLGRLPFAIGLSRQARSIIRQNLWLSMGVIAVLILATTTGIFRIGPAVLRPHRPRSHVDVLARSIPEGYSCSD